MRLLHVQQPVPQAVVSSWVIHAFTKESQRSQETLTSLRLWQETNISGGLESWLLNGTFRYLTMSYWCHAPTRANLRMALSGGGQPWTMSAYLEPDPKGRDIASLDSYAGERWVALLLPPARWETIAQSHMRAPSVRTGTVSL